MTTQTEAPRPNRAPAITVATAVFGGLVLAGTGAMAAIGATNAVNRTEFVQTEDVAGIRGIDIDAGGTSFTLAFGDVSEATLEVTGSRGEWRLQRDGEDLVVESPRPFFGLSVGLLWFGDSEVVTLTLPESLRGERLDADVSLGAGSFRADGDFGELDVSLGAGALTIDGSAETVDVRVSAGRADLALADVSAAELSVSAGRLEAELSGEAPRLVDVRASAGSLDLTVPDVDYRVRSDVSAGGLNNDLRVSSSAPREIVVDVSAGSIDLRPGRR